MPGLFEKSAIVVAHPDDEVLWMSSILDRVDEIIICFLDHPAIPALGKGRRESLSEYPIEKVSCLDICESNAFDLASWPEPVISEFGLELNADREAGYRYQSNFHMIYDQLHRRLDGVKNVFTHNPWGEYGHEEHIQVYRVVQSLREKLGYEVWFSNYFWKRSAALMSASLDKLHPKYHVFETNHQINRTIMDVYRRHRCWTWPEDYKWPEKEVFYRNQHLVEAGSIDSCCHPLNLIRVDLDFNRNASSRKGHSWKKRLRKFLRGSDR